MIIKRYNTVIILFIFAQIIGYFVLGYANYTTHDDDGVVFKYHIQNNKPLLNHKVNF